MNKRIVSFCTSLLTILAAAFLPCMTVAATADYDAAAQTALAYAERSSGHFYYDWLEEFDRSAAYKRYYAYLGDFCKRIVSYSEDFPHNEYFIELNADSPVSWAPDTSGLSNDDLLSCMHIFLKDHPYYAFLFSAFTIDDTIKIPFAFAFDTAAGRKQIFTKINDYIDTYSGAEAVSDPYERAKYIHDKLCISNTSTYDATLHPSEGGWTNNIYGPVFYRTSVCEGYALTYHMLCRYYGLETACVMGSSRNEAHMWNILKLDGMNYYVDVTWDDSLDPQDSWSDDFIDTYFAKGSDFFEKDHHRDTNESFVHEPVGDPAESRVIPSLARNAYEEKQKAVKQSTATTAAASMNTVNNTTAETTVSAETSSAPESAASQTISTASSATVNTVSAASSESSHTTNSELTTGTETAAVSSAASAAASSDSASENGTAASVSTAGNSTDSGQSGSGLWIIVLSVIGGSALLGAAVMIIRKRPK